MKQERNRCFLKEEKELKLGMKMKKVLEAYCFREGKKLKVVKWEVVYDQRLSSDSFH